MRLIFHGVLRELYGESAEMNASSIADAIEGFSIQQRNWPRKVPISVVGYDNIEEMRRAKPDEIHLMPTLSGGGGIGKYVNIIIGAAMVVAGILLLGTPFGVPLIISGASMVLMGIVQLFMKAPTLDNDEDSIANSKYLGINKNTVATRTPMILLYGRTIVYPHWLSLQSDSSLMAHGSFPVSPT